MHTALDFASLGEYIVIHAIFTPSEIAAILDSFLWGIDHTRARTGGGEFSMSLLPTVRANTKST